MFVTRDPLGNPVDRRHPWNQHTNPQPQKRDFDDKYSWVMSPRWFDGTDHLALDTGGGPLARLWSTALSGLVDIGYVKATGTSVHDQPAEDGAQARGDVRVEDPAVVEHDRAQPGPHLLPGLRRRAPRCTSSRRRWPRCAPARTKTWEPFEVPDEGIGCGFTEAVRGVLSHHMVIKGGKIANYHPYPPTPWNANPRDIYGTPGPYEDAVHGHARSSRRTTSTTSRASTSCGPSAASTRACRAACTCTSAKGKVLKKVHSPTQVANPDAGVLSPTEAGGTAWPRRTSGRSATGSSGCSTSCTAAADPRAYDHVEELVRLVTELYGAGLERVVELAGEVDEAPGARAPPRRRRADRQPARWCTGCIPTASRPRVERALEVGAAVPRAPRRRRRAARRRRGVGRRAPAAARELRRLPVVGGDAAHAVERAINEAAPEIVIIDVEDRRRRRRPPSLPSAGDPQAASPTTPATRLCQRCA